MGDGGSKYSVLLQGPRAQPQAGRASDALMARRGGNQNLHRQGGRPAGSLSIALSLSLSLSAFSATPVCAGRKTLISGSPYTRCWYSRQNKRLILWGTADVDIYVYCIEEEDFFRVLPVEVIM